MVHTLGVPIKDEEMLPNISDICNWVCTISALFFCK